MTNQKDKASAKDKVLAWVRSKNPQTMELKKGCKCVFRELYGEKATWDGYIGYEERQDERIKKTQEKVILEFWEYGNDEHGSFSTHYEIVEILGSDMGLQELMIAFKSIHGMKAYIGVHSNFPFGNKDFHEGLLVLHIQSSVSPYSHNIGFDLSKNLHQQPDEFYEAILPLISHD